MSARAVLDTVNLEITVTHSDAHEAQLLAQSYAEQLSELVSELERPAGAREAPVKASIVDTASLDTDPVNPKPKQNIALGIVAGLLLGVGIAILRSVFDTRVRSADDIAAVIDRPVLGVIGFDPQSQSVPLVTDIPSHAPRAEAFRVLRTNLQFVDVDKQRRVFVITSAVPGEGKTSTAVNLAISLAQGGSKTLLVEADLRRPRAAQKLGLDGSIGVTTVLVGSIGWQDALINHASSGLDLLAAGAIPPNPAELIQSRAMGDLLESLRAQYDVVIVDAPPLLPVADAALLAASADGAILVARHGRTTRDQLSHAWERLDAVDAKVVGVVLNMVKGTSEKHGYGYGYGYAPSESES
ncbi:polysaccharide biosynthesis tyrosine autokinase [Nocardioides faecalis]|uniref:polysaccharide biosynthesis tyrosine autokinase n=1 Tax=Nocardioides faecalis TaxID=2803858 RepID=UPI0020C161D0|nr:polysaccharide biosynthesis tyrosine autokinase [Nocardioides faecalis]